jgi:KDO2-lipid IV(A) lauroyltransferase
LSRDVLADRPWLRRFAYRFAFLLGALAPLWFMRTLAYFLGVATWLGDKRGRETVRRNIGHFIPDSCPDALSRCVRRSYINFFLSLAESFQLAHLKPAHFKQPLVTLHDPWRVFAERPIKGPVILVTIHANWEMAVGIYHHLNLIDQIEVIALSHHDQVIDRLLEQRRNALAAKSLLLDHAPLASLRALRDGKVLGVVGDRDYTGSGLTLPFAGEPMSMPVGSAALAVQTQARIVPCLIGRSGACRFKVIVGRPLTPSGVASKTQQVDAMTRALAATFARFICAAPSQWVAFHDAWRKA